MLEKIDPHKTQGPDELPAKVLKERAAEIAPALSSPPMSLAMFQKNGERQTFPHL